MRRVGRLVLDRNVKNASPRPSKSHSARRTSCPGIEFSNDPLAAGTQLLVSRYASEAARRPELRAAADQCAAVPVPPFSAGRHMAMFNPSGRVNYAPNSWLAGRVAGEAPSGGFVSYREDVSGTKVRARPESFADHYNQARQFYVEPNAARAPAHRGGARIRAQQGRNAGDSLARRRASAEHRRQARDERRRRLAPRRAAGGGDASRAAPRAICRRRRRSASCAARRRRSAAAASACS